MGQKNLEETKLIKATIKITTITNVLKGKRKNKLHSRKKTGM